VAQEPRAPSSNSDCRRDAESSAAGRASSASAVSRNVVSVVPRVCAVRIVLCAPSEMAAYLRLQAELLQAEPRMMTSLAK